MDAKTIEKIVEVIRHEPPKLMTLGPETAYVVVPNGYQLQSASHLLPPPSRPRQTVKLLTVEAFCAYVRSFKTETTVIFADEYSAIYEAVLDYHQTNTRGHCDHIAVYDCPHSPQWVAWTGQHGKLVKQGEFARFIENNLPDIIEPSSADMMQVALSLDVKKNVKFQSDLRLSNGQHQFRYEEEIRGTVRALDIEVPETFRLFIPVFLDGARMCVDARLRYRLNDGELQMGYELVRHQQVALDAARDVTRTIKAELYGSDLYSGARR